MLNVSVHPRALDLAGFASLTPKEQDPFSELRLRNLFRTIEMLIHSPAEVVC
jgi:hypothetical protein